MFSGKKKKLRSSETLKLSTSKRTPAYFSDDLKIGHVSTIARFPNQIVTESQTGTLPESPTISAEKMKNRFKYHTILLYGLYICLPLALVLLFGLAFAAYYSPRRERVQVWMVHPFMKKSFCNKKTFKLYYQSVHGWIWENMNTREEEHMRHFARTIPRSILPSALSASASILLLDTTASPPPASSPPASPPPISSA